VLVGLLLVLAAGVLLAAPASPGTGTPEGEELGAPEALADCVAARGHLLVQFVIDESGSLRETDPEHRRVDAIRTALAGIDGIRAGGGEDAPTVEVSLAGFSVGYETLEPWTTLDDAAADRLQAGAAAFADRNRGFDTDYVVALQGAQASLADRSAAITAGGDDAPCKALIWFTDGEFDIEDRTSDRSLQHGTNKPWAPDFDLQRDGAGDELEARGIKVICDADGVADQIRGDDAIFITVPLATQITPEREAQLESITVGTSGGQTCGSTEAVGAYLSSDDGKGLLGIFDGVISGSQGGTPVVPEPPVPVCTGSSCVEGTHTFTVDPGIRQLHVLALTGSAGIDVELVAPDGAMLPIAAGENGTAELDGSDVTFTWVAPDALVLDVFLPADDDAAGEWKLTFIDRTGQNPGAVASSQIHLFGDVTPVLLDEEELVFRLGEDTPFAFELQRQEGTPPTGDVFETIEATAVVTIPETGERRDVPVTADADGTYRGEFAVPEDVHASVLNLTLRADATTASGVALRPVVRTTAVPVGLPLSYPQVEPPELRLSSVTGTEAAAGELVVTGSDEGAGCAWVEGIEIIEAPDEVGDLATTPAPASREDCLEVPQGEQRTIEITAQPAEAGRGSVEGTVRLGLTSQVASDEVVSLEVPLSFDVARPVNQARRVGLFLGLLIPGILLPFLVLWGVNWFGARFEPPSELRSAFVPVRIDDGAVARASGEGEGLFDGGRSFENVGEPIERTREFSVSGVTFRGRVHLVPFLPPYGQASAEGLRIGSAWPYAGPVDGRTTRVPLALPKTWLFVASDEQLASGQGSVLAFVETGAGSEQLPEVERSIREGLPSLVRDLQDVQRGEEEAAAASEEAKANKAAERTGRSKDADAPAGAVPAAASTDEGDDGGWSSGSTTPAFEADEHDDDGGWSSGSTSPSTTTSSPGVLDDDDGGWSSSTDDQPSTPPPSEDDDDGGWSSSRSDDW
jgi:hypothetical protein